MFFKDENGTSIVEVMVAIVVFMIIMMGGLNYFLQPQSMIGRQKIKRLAISAAQSRMETLLALDFTQITSDSNETNTSVLLGSITGLRSTTVTAIDDAADGLGGSDADGDTVDYKTILVELSWTAGSDQAISFSTKVSDIDYSDGGGSGGGPASETLRPMGSGTYTDLTSSGCSSNWQCVDEATADEDATYVIGSGGSWDTDTFATENSSIGTGTIDSVIVYVRCMGDNDHRIKTAIKTNGSLYEGPDTNLTSTYTNYSSTYVTNPNTSSTWTWSEIDAIEIGVTIKKEGRCTQVWLEIYYTN